MEKCSRPTVRPTVRPPAKSLFCGLNIGLLPPWIHPEGTAKRRTHKQKLSKSQNNTSYSTC